MPSRPSPVAHGRATVKSGDQTGTNGDRETWLLAAGSAAVTLGSEPACTALRSKATDVSTEYSGYIPAFRVDHRPKDRCSVTEELQQQLAVGGLTSSCRGMPYVSGRDSPEIMATRGDPINYTPVSSQRKGGKNFTLFVVLAVCRCEILYMYQWYLTI